MVVTAGLYPTPDAGGDIPDAAWAHAFGVNVTGSWIVADEAARIWSAQDLPGSLVLTTSANAVVVKSGSLAYDTSKAAANHLVRELAMRLAPKIRVNAVAPATVLDGSAMFPRDRVIDSLARYGLPCEEEEDTDHAASPAGGLLCRAYAYPPGYSSSRIRRRPFFCWRAGV